MRKLTPSPPLRDGEFAWIKIAQAESSFAQKARNELAEIETKLDRLLDLQLDGNLSQAEYTAKKHKLILAKKDLEEKITAFGRKSNNRFELAIAFLKDASQAEKYAQQESAQGGRDFLKKIGSNFRIADRTLACDFKNAFKIAEKYHAEALCTEATSFNFTECKTCGGGRIRTLGTREDTAVFETAPFDRSGTPPVIIFNFVIRRHS